MFQALHLALLILLVGVKVAGRGVVAGVGIDGRRVGVVRVKPGIGGDQRIIVVRPVISQGVGAKEAVVLEAVVLEAVGKKHRRAESRAQSNSGARRTKKRRAATARDRTAGGKSPAPGRPDRHSTASLCPDRHRQQPRNQPRNGQPAPHCTDYTAGRGATNRLNFDPRPRAIAGTACNK